MSRRSTGASEIDTNKLRISSYLSKRTKTHQWKKKWAVLRNCQLSYYKDDSEHRALKVYPTSDILSVSEIKDNSKYYHFAVYTGEKVIHLRTEDEKTKQNWITELQSVINGAKDGNSEKGVQHGDDEKKEDREIEDKSTTNSVDHSNSTRKGKVIISDEQFAQSIGRQATDEMNYSGNDEMYMSSGESDSSLREAPFSPRPIVDEATEYEIEPRSPSKALKTTKADSKKESANEEEFIHEGSLLRLHKRYNQWKKVYIVLSDRTLNLHKHETDKEPYKRLLVKDLVDVIEIDPISSSKKWCFLIITPNKRIRLCAASEDEMTQWLASLKTVINRQKELE
ncbi:hypothetical protein CLIB1423_20S00122 [[Candida] railenensis]|uniref:PH domain-containing protein n=1 Tax=[Candida] railenensis TaxID=45579 RepID=A0A9P0QV62_9ASCO|nr:hypothetical protein CLIB1423_20S00122 [[Candida] railenensis]